MPSSSSIVPCSIESTPAASATLMPSAPCACTATFLPYSFAVSTIARASSSNICWPSPAPTWLFTPPVVAILMTSTPRADLHPHRAATRFGAVAEVVVARGAPRASLRDSRAPRPCGPTWSRSSGRHRRCSGPITFPARIASRSASVTPSLSPRLRTVVKPARKRLARVDQRVVRLRRRLELHAPRAAPAGRRCRSRGARGCR